MSAKCKTTNQSVFVQQTKRVNTTKRKRRIVFTNKSLYSSASEIFSCDMVTDCLVQMPNSNSNTQTFPLFYIDLCSRLHALKMNNNICKVV